MKMYKNSYQNHELVINHARHLLQTMDEKDAMHMLKTHGVKPALAYLATKAAKIIREPYVYKEIEGRMIRP